MGNGQNGKDCKNHNNDQNLQQGSFIFIIRLRCQHVIFLLKNQIEKMFAPEFSGMA